MVLSPDSGAGATDARLRGKIALGVGVTMVHEALGAADARDGIDGRPHAIWSVVASTPAVFFRSVRVLTVFATDPTRGAFTTGRRVEVTNAHFGTAGAAVTATSLLLPTTSLAGQHWRRSRHTGTAVD